MPNHLKLVNTGTSTNENHQQKWAVTNDFQVQVSKTTLGHEQLGNVNENKGRK